TPTPTPTPAPVVIPAVEPLPPAGVPIAVSSPSFESGLGRWVAPSGIVDGPNSKARGGVRSLVVPGAPGRTVTQTVSTNVAAGSTYVFTVYIRADGAAAGIVRLRTVGGATVVKGEVNFTASSTGWLRASITMTVKTAHTGFSLEIVTSTTGRSYRLDSVSLVRTGQTVVAGPATLTATSGTTPVSTPTVPSATTAAPAPTPAPAPAPTPTVTPTPAVTPTPTVTSVPQLVGLLAPR
ncbi:MAG TPA: hypothetical protein VNS80_09910, partial [Pseudolysinimonas sp.]|nr:hypothetical protein [Pseudolysinimonas sp.]